MSGFYITFGKMGRAIKEAVPLFLAIFVVVTQRLSITQYVTKSVTQRITQCEHFVRTEITVSIPSVIN